MRDAAANDLPVPLRSATVAVLRDAAAGPEVLLVLRHSKASFGANYAFPGGVHEDVDAEVADLCDGCTEQHACAQLGVAALGLKYYSAAIRELFEETGVLLARRRASPGHSSLVNNNAYDEERSAVHSGALSWRDFLLQRDLRLACDQLRYFSYWVTPRRRPKRFTTRFFATALPTGQHASHDGKELTDSCWITPASALQAADAGQMVMPPPTRATLNDLARFGSVDEILGWAGRQQASGVPCTLPALVGDGDGARIVLPGSADYPADHLGKDE